MDAPDDWTPEQIAMWRRILADPHARAEAVSWMLERAVLLEREFAAYERKNSSSA